MVSRVHRALYPLCCAFWLLGCSNEGPYETVKYDQPPEQPDAVVALSAHDEPVQPATALNLEPGKVVVYRGTVANKSPERPKHLMLLQIFTRLPNGEKVVMNSATAVGKVAGKNIQFELHLKTPAMSGRFGLELLQSDGENQVVVAQREVRIP